MNKSMECSRQMVVLEGHRPLAMEPVEGEEEDSSMFPPKVLQLAQPLCLEERQGVMLPL
jgi:hypothetical protein